MEGDGTGRDGTEEKRKGEERGLVKAFDRHFANLLQTDSWYISSLSAPCSPFLSHWAQLSGESEDEAPFCSCLCTFCALNL